MIKKEEIQTKKTKRKNFSRIFDRISSRVTRATGSAYTFILAVLFVITWLVSGPIFEFSNTWQLIINTSTTIVTFLMVFLIQQSQNKDTTAIQLKLNELIACNAKASNRLVDIEDLTDEELQILKKFYIHLSKLSEKENHNLYSTHSIDDAAKNQASKDESYRHHGRKHYPRRKAKPSTAIEKNGSGRNPVKS